MGYYARILQKDKPEITYVYESCYYSSPPPVQKHVRVYKIENIDKEGYPFRSAEIMNDYGGIGDAYEIIAEMNFIQGLFPENSFGSQYVEVDQARRKPYPENPHYLDGNIYFYEILENTGAHKGQKDTKRSHLERRDEKAPLILARFIDPGGIIIS
jgi:hypothetical protein